MMLIWRCAFAVLANNDAMALGAMDAYEKLGYTETNRPVFFGIDGTKEGLEAVKDGTLAATVYNDKEGQAAAMANLAFSIATEDENNPNPFKNYKYIETEFNKVRLHDASGEAKKHYLFCKSIYGTSSK